MVDLLHSHLATTPEHLMKFWTLTWQHSYILSQTSSPVEWIWGLCPLVLLPQRHAVINQSLRSSPGIVAMTMHRVLKAGFGLWGDDVINGSRSRPPSQVWCWCRDRKGWALLHWGLNDNLFCEHPSVTGYVCIWNFPLDKPTTHISTKLDMRKLTAPCMYLLN